MKRNVKSHSIFIWAGHLFYSVELHISFCRLSLSPNVINLNVKLYSIFPTNIRIEHMLDRERERERERERGSERGREKERERQRITYLQGCSLCLSLSPSLCLLVSLSIRLSVSLFLTIFSLSLSFLSLTPCPSLWPSLCLSKSPLSSCNRFTLSVSSIDKKCFELLECIYNIFSVLNRMSGRICQGRWLMCW